MRLPLMDTSVRRETWTSSSRLSSRTVSGSPSYSSGHFVFSTAHGLLDALSWIAGFDHGVLESRALSVKLSDGTTLRVCSYEDLVAMKQLAGRPRDREDLRELEALRTEEAEQ
jgi:hypothetical protein